MEYHVEEMRIFFQCFLDKLQMSYCKTKELLV